MVLSKSSFYDCEMNSSKIRRVLALTSSVKGGLVDVHVHPPTKEFLLDSGGPHVEAAAKKFGHRIELKTFDQMLGEYSGCGIEKLVLFA